MAKRTKKRAKVDLSAAETSTSPLGGLGALLAEKGLQFQGTAESAESVGPDPTTWSWSDVSKVVLQRERKGRGGKTVTVIRGLPLVAFDEVSGQLKRHLGVGVRVEDDALVTQGDQRQRLETWFVGQGVRRVIC